MEDINNEILNMHANNPKNWGELRLKPYIVVTKQFYLDLVRLHSGLKLLADGMFIENGEQLPMDLPLRQLLIDNDFYEFDKLDKQLSLVRGDK